MNYLQLVQRAIKESGATLSPPSSLSDLKGLEEKFALWVKESWNEIQRERSDWLFSAKEQELDLDPLLLDQGVLVPPSEFADDYLQEWKQLPMIEVWLEEYIEPEFTYELLLVDDLESSGNIAFQVLNPDYTPEGSEDQYIDVFVIEEE